MLLRIYARIVLFKLLFLGTLLQEFFQQLRILRRPHILSGQQAHFVLWYPLRFQDRERAGQVLGHFHEAAIVLEHAAIVGRAEDCDQLPVCEKLVAIVDHEVAPADKIDIVLLTEVVDDLLVEGKADTALVLLPLGLCGLRVTPEDVTKQASVGHIGWLLQAQYLLWYLEFW